MSYVKRRKESVFTELKNLPKMRSRARHEVFRKLYGALLIVGVTSVVVVAINMTVGKGGF
ncbi:MAG: hypothetical protein ACLGIN_05410 [Candidatus Sericytochromatia bacterium]